MRRKKGNGSAAPISPPSTLREGYTIDFIDGIQRRKTAEEYVRQNVEHSLVQEYRYPPEDIDVEFSVKMGRARKRADIAIFGEGAPHTQENVFLLCECKSAEVSSNDKAEGIEQLKSYMSACLNCRFGLWTNGSDERICLRRDDDGKTEVYVEIIDIPIKGADVKDADYPTRLLLRAATGDNLLLAFKRCHNYITGNSGMHKQEAFTELLKVIFCKIEDERKLGDLRFYVTSSERKTTDGQLRCKRRIGRIWDEVKAKFPKIFKTTEEIELKNEVLSYIVAQVQGFSFLDSDVDVKGVAYEEIVGDNLRGDRGEFFTPRNACRMAVNVLDPGPDKHIIDPACGTGGFLVTAMNHVLRKIDAAHQRRWRNSNSPSPRELEALFTARKDYMNRFVAGLDINPLLVRATKMNMVMNNDGSGGLTQADSLRDAVTWSREAQELAPLDSFDYLFTNPPFGANIKIDSRDVLLQYDLGAIWDFDEAQGRWTMRTDAGGRRVLQESRPPEILFIERSLKLLKPGTGQMAIVIPNGILNNPPLGYVRQWILENAQVLAVVDMQRDLFMPKNDTQTSMLFLRRKSDRERLLPFDYPILMVVTDKIGHDKRGKPIYKRDVDGTDILESKPLKIKTVEGGQVVEKTIQETVPVIDDQLPDVPPLYHAWAKEHFV